jgi:hypothetical protein
LFSSAVCMRLATSPVTLSTRFGETLDFARMVWFIILDIDSVDGLSSLSSSDL